MSTKSNVDSTSYTSARPTKKRRLASPIELAPSAPEPALITPDDTVTPTSPPLPLTRENLRALAKMSSAGPSSYKSKTQSSASGGSSKDPSTSDVSLRALLGELHIHINRKSYTEHSDTNELINTCIMKERSSPGLKKEKAKELAQTSRALRTRNEATSIHALMDLIFPRPEWLADGKAGLDRSSEARFKPGCVPMPKGSSKEPQLQALLESAKQPSNPRSDIAFGIEKSSWSSTETLTNRQINERYGNLAYPCGEVATSYPFLLAEWKSVATGGNHLQAETQTARGGAALISNMQKLLAATLDTSTLTKDTLTSLNTVFSATCDSESIRFFVHWSESIPGTGDRSYEMSRIRSFMLDEPDMLPAMQRMVNNIFEWGLLERKTALTNLIKLQTAQLTHSP